MTLRTNLKELVSIVPSRLWRPIIPGIVTDLLFPVRCCVCLHQHSALSSNNPVCGPCSKILTPSSSRCLRCCSPLPAVAGPNKDCIHCRKEKWSFKHVYALAPYQGILKQAVIQAKQPNGESIAIGLGLELGKWLKKIELTNYDGIVASPQFWTRRLSHRTNSADLIARSVSKSLGIPILSHGLKRTKYTEKQGILRTMERRKNVAGAFQVRSIVDFKKKKLLIVDDVLTSGATASEMAKTLRKAGAKLVDVAVIARGIGEGGARYAGQKSSNAIE